MPKKHVFYAFHALKNKKTLNINKISFYILLSY
jgi:hypothetical protein